MRHITLLGSTGSIGDSTLDVISRHPERFAVHALTAQTRWEKLAAQCIQFKPLHAVIGDASKRGVLQDALKQGKCATQVHTGAESMAAVAGDPLADTVVAAIVGAAGLIPTLTAVSTGKRLLLANKETLVCAGNILMREARASGAQIIPLDSEHNAIFQCLPNDGSTSLSISGKGVQRIILTASGGPFLRTPLAELAHVTPQQAVKHPNWQMGKKISVDSATMMNKGLEVIEAHWLFEAAASKIDVLIHPQSIVHSMVEYVDGSTLAQLGSPDMRTPIANALAWPDRIGSGSPRLDLATSGPMEFFAPDFTRFPCLSLAFSALKAGQCASTTLNAANEVAVEAFLKGAISFTQIADTVQHTLNSFEQVPIDDLDGVLAADHLARVRANEGMRTWM